MLIEFYFKANINAMNIIVPYLGVDIETIGNLLIYTEDNQIIANDVTEDEKRQYYIEIGENLTEEQYKQIQSYYGISFEEFKKNYEDGLKNNTSSWEIVKENFKLVYPFNIHSLDSSFITKYVSIYTSKIISENTRFGGTIFGSLLFLFWNKYSFNLWVYGYDELSIDEQIIFEKKLLNDFKNSFLRYKKISLNDKLLI